MSLPNFDANLSRLIDHTLLKPDATPQDIANLCAEAGTYQFAAVCVPPVYVQQAANTLSGSGVAIATVIGFPLGYNLLPIKLSEIEKVAALGATEIDMVINLGAAKSANWNYLIAEIEAAAKTTHKKSGNLLKVIIETALLTEKEIETICHICARSRVDFVKTSTGFNGGGATIEAVQLMRQVLPAHIKIKASGGIRTRQDALNMVKAGANRLGCSASVKIVSL